MNMEPQYRSDDGSALRIFREAVQNNFLSEKLGRPVFDEAIFVEVISPGSRGSVPIFEVERTCATEEGGIPENATPKVNQQQYAKYAKYIENFKSKENDASLIGTPLNEWPEIGVSLIATLKAANIHTVDALANVPDNLLNVIGPDGRTWRTKAQAFIAMAEGSAVVTAMAAENEQLRAQLDDQQAAMQSLVARIDELENAKASSVLPDLSDGVVTPVAAPEPSKGKGKAAAADQII